MTRTSLAGNPLAPAAGRRFVRTALADWSGAGLPAAALLGQRVADDLILVVDELVTNAVVHAGTTVELLLRLEEPAEDRPAAVVLEVSDHHPTRPLQSTRPGSGAGEDGMEEYGRGLQLVAALAECWGITYRSGLKTVWARLPLDDWETGTLVTGSGPGAGEPAAEPAVRRGLRAAGILAPVPRPAARDEREWIDRGAPSFLAEASDLLAGQLDEDMVAALAGQLLVPRLGDWCAFWLEGCDGGEPRLARVWHADESALERLRAVLEKEPPRLTEAAGTAPVRLAWPEAAGEGSALAYRLVAGGQAYGTLLLGHRTPCRVPERVTALVEDFARRVALAIGAARRYTRQATISRVLQRGLLPSRVARIPGVESCVVYEPSDEGLAGGDFYDVFQSGAGAPGAPARWCFMLGDVQGSGPEAAVVTGLARPWLRLLAREGHPVGHVLERLNRLLLDESMEAAEAAALVVAAAGGQEPLAPVQPRFLSLLYGELQPLGPEEGGGARCTLACAGHPLPLLLRPDGTVTQAASPQLLLGVVDDVRFQSQSFRLAPGDTLLCVTDGVTERRAPSGRMFDDGDGLARALAECAGLPARDVGDRLRQAVHSFGETPVRDDLALLVLQAR
ncbi:SpoIIE family protein phosphatase [Streptomyces sp. LP05-1]|uniref:SpoIIE family protein phosphatase n=1 Tax=Streptomyces pyxinae TaxID=2970734 RepID=A0ABT2CL71_9ACTN|nr:SpoIIE family protein phosphatase [Streptomyces sp. LP05-1]MCS0638152.1 SpoIIE family protein phosphatase [Streptomyces sp. LP05-1]